MAEWSSLHEQTRPNLTGPVLAALQARLHDVAQQTIDAVAQEVPGYRGTLDDAAQAILAQAVELALSGFLSLAAADQDPSAPLAPALQGAFALGQGEARRGRPMDALLAAYRVGARVSWRGLAGAAVDAGLPADEVVLFAELVFAYIDALSAASVAGHAEELAVADRLRQRHLERLAHGLLVGAPADQVQAAAQRAEWAPPVGLIAVVLPESRVADVLARIDSRTLQPVDDIPGLDPGVTVLLVPDPDARFHAGLARGLAGEGAVIGPVRPWLEASASFQRALRAGVWVWRGHRLEQARAVRALRLPVASSTPRRFSPSCSSARIPPRWPTCGPGRWPRWPGCGQPSAPGSSKRCGRGCCTAGDATMSPPPCSSTRRPSATGWARSASCSATRSTTRGSPSNSPWRSPSRRALPRPSHTTHPDRSARRPAETLWG